MAFSQLSVKKLDASNFVNWSVDVKFLLQEKNCWNIVDGTEKLPVENETTTGKDVNDYKLRENLALLTIHSNIQPEYRWLIEDCKNAAEVWDTLKRHFQPNNRAQHMQLFNELIDCKIMPGEKLVVFASRLMRLSEQLKDIGQPLGEFYLSFLLLRNLPSKFENIVGEILRWPDDKFLFKDIVLELVAQESRLAITEKDSTTCDMEVKNSKKKPVRCFLCKKKGHVKNECRFIYRNSQISSISSQKSCTNSSKPVKSVTASLCESTTYERIKTHVTRFLH